MRKALVLVLCLISTSLWSQWTVNGDLVVINFTAFNIGYSDSLRMPIWSHYKLTASMVKARKVAKRRSTPYKDRTSRPSSDFTGSGYDRGHMVPFAAMDFDEQTGLETFSMYNIAPQVPKINRGIWKRLEDYETGLAEDLGCIYVNVDNLFVGDTVITTKGLPLPVPRSQTKTIYDCDGVQISKHIILNK